MATEVAKEQKGTISRKHISRDAESNALHSYGQAIEHSMNFSNVGYPNQVVQTMYGYSRQTPLQQKAESEEELQMPQEPLLQRKLTIGSPDDHYEKEADYVANQVMQMPKPAVQRKCAHCQVEKGRVQLKPLAASITPFVQAKATQERGISTAVSQQLKSNRGGGSPIADPAKHDMEESFGADFSGVRVHTDSQAIQLSQELNAQAFTTGNDIYFNEGKFSPESSEGKQLLAHELTHTVQQNGLYRKKDSLVQRTPIIQRQDEPQGETDQRRLIARFLPSARPGIRRVLSLLRMVGIPVSGVAIGVRLSGTAGDTVQVGAGVDSLYFLDIANLELTTDTLAYGELGVGLTVGAGGGIIVGIRISPNAQYGSMSGAYGGSAFNFSLRMIAGVGFSISPGIFSGQEGFLAATFSIGAQAGVSASASYAVSGTDAIAAAEAAVNGINRLGEGLASGLAAIQAVGGIGQAILSGMFVRPVVVARASLMPSNWNLRALPSRTRAHLNMLGAVMNLSGSPDQMLAYMSRRMSSLPIQPLINEMSADIVQVLQSRGTTPDRIRAAYMSPQFIGSMTVLSFIRTLYDYGLLQFVRSPEEIADEMMRPSQPAAAE